MTQMPAALNRLPAARILEGILFYGQSNCGGPVEPVTSLLEARHPFHVLSFRSSYRYGVASQARRPWNGFAPYQNPNTYLYVQTPFAWYLEQLRAQAALPPSARFIFTVWAGGQPITDFFPGTQTCQTLLDTVSDLERVGTRKRFIPRINAIVWIHGEGGTLGYRAQLETLIQGANTGISAITGHTPHWFIAQINNPTGVSHLNPVAINQSRAALDTPGRTLIGPMYQLPLRDGIHTNESGRMMFGELIALVYHRVMVEKRIFKPLHPLRVEQNGNRLRLVFHVPDEPLAWDNDWVEPAAKYGFAVENAQGKPAKVLRVEISGPDSVDIHLASPLKGGRVLYAMGQSKPASGWAGARGQLMSPTRYPSLFYLEGYPVPAFVRHYAVRFILPFGDRPQRPQPQKPKASKHPGKTRAGAVTGN